MTHIYEGSPLPDCRLAILRNHEIERKKLSAWIGDGRAILFGVAQAFTPVCTRVHIPQLVQVLPKLKAAGYDRVFVIVPDNPWTIDAWRETLATPAEITFLGDGNREFVTACGLEETSKKLGMGSCSRRYMMQVFKGRVHRLKVEKSINDIDVTDTGLTMDVAPAVLNQTQYAH